MNRLPVRLFLLLILFNLLTGCWNRREMTDLAIAGALGIDKEGDKYQVTVQVINPGEVAANQGGTGRTPVIVFKKTGDTIFEALRKITAMSPRKIYYSHTRMVIIGEEVAKEGIAKALDFTARDHEFRNDFYIAVTKGGKAENILQILTTIEKIPANKMYSSLETSSKALAATGTIQLDELIKDMVSEGKEPVITGIEAIGPIKKGESMDNLKFSDAPSRLQYEEMAVFKGDKLIDWLSENESKGYNYARGKVKSTVGHVNCPKGGKMSIEVVRTEGKITGKVKRGVPEVLIDVWVEGNVGEANCDMDLSKSETIEQLELLVKERVKFVLETAVKKEKKLKTDFLGFGAAIRRDEPKEWKRLKENWEKELADLSVKYKVDVQIRRTGKIENTFIGDIKE